MFTLGKNFAIMFSTGKTSERCIELAKTNLCHRQVMRRSKNHRRSSNNTLKGMGMDDKTTELITRLAEKLGTTAEHLWGVLLHQAPISGTINLVISIFMVLSTVCLVRFVKGKTTKAKTEVKVYPCAEWEDEGAALAWFLTAVYLLITFGTVTLSITGIVSAFFNPEYWALSHILGKM